MEKMGFEGKDGAAQASLGDDLWEMHGAGEKIVEFTAGRTLAEYEESEVLQAVVERMLAIMAEALARLTPEIATRLEAPELGTIAAKPQPEVWRFVREALPEIVARIRVELEAWHEA